MAALTASQTRDAIVAATGNPANAAPDESPWEWFWHAVQGDFNDNRSTKQIVMDAAISMIPGIDQLCDVRDLIANCKKLYHDSEDVWSWVALVLTLIGLFPVLGSLVKGVLKIVIAFVVRAGKAATPRAIEQSISWVVAFLRRQDVQKYIKIKKIDEVLSWLAAELKILRNKIDIAALISAFDKGINVVTALVNKVSLIPSVAGKAKHTLDMITAVRLKADAGLRQAIKPVTDILDETILALERRALLEQHGILDVNNVHYYGTIPEADAISIMSRKDHPDWLSDGVPTKYKQANARAERAQVDKEVLNGYPPLSDTNIESFHRLIAAEIKGPAKLYRILSPNSKAMGDCWISEDVFKSLQNAPDPKAAWRKFLAVWPDWNANGQFVMYEVKQGETLKVWRGEASAQTKVGLNDRYLEGGYEQIIFKIDRADASNDTIRFYELIGANRNVLGPSIDEKTYYSLSESARAKYMPVREQINHPNISGPYDTGWDLIDFNGDGFLYRIGLPSLHGQVTTQR